MDKITKLNDCDVSMRAIKKHIVLSMVKWWFYLLGLKKQGMLYMAVTIWNDDQRGRGLKRLVITCTEGI